MWEMGTYYNYVIQMNICHALNYKIGGLVMTILENDNGTQMSKLIYPYPYSSCEPVIRETDGLHTPALFRDLKIVLQSSL